MKEQYKMPSRFIVEQAELLHRSQDPEIVLENIRNKYATSSFCSQMSRVKSEWYKFNERHDDFFETMNSEYERFKASDVPRKPLKELKHYIKDDLSTQMKKRRSIKTPGGLSGDENIDFLISSTPLLPEYMKKYQLSPEDRVVSSELSKKSLEDRSMDCVTVEDADQLLETCKKTIKSLDDDPFFIAACLSVVCGRRSIELLKTGNFQGCEGNELSCLFSGAAKKKSMCTKLCEIPLLMKSKYVLVGLRHIREHIPCTGLSNSQINSKYSHKLGDAAKILMNHLGVRFHDLRCIYGMASFRMYSHDGSINIWLKKSLLHETLDTSIFYSRCKIEKCDTKLGRWNL